MNTIKYIYILIYEIIILRLWINNMELNYFQAWSLIIYRSVGWNLQNTTRSNHGVKFASCRTFQYSAIVWIAIIFPLSSSQMWPWQRPWQRSRGRPGLSTLLLPHDRHGQDPAPSRTHHWQPEPRWEPQPGGAALPQQQPLQAASLPHHPPAPPARPVPGLRQGQGHLLRRPLAPCPVGGQCGLLGAAVPRLLLHWWGGSATAGPSGQQEHRRGPAKESDNTAAGDKPEEMSRELEGIYYGHSFPFFFPHCFWHKV